MSTVSAKEPEASCEIVHKKLRGNFMKLAHFLEDYENTYNEDSKGWIKYWEKESYRLATIYNAMCRN